MKAKIILITLGLLFTQEPIQATNGEIRTLFTLSYITGLVPIVGQMAIPALLMAASDNPKTNPTILAYTLLLGHALGVATISAALYFCMVGIKTTLCPKKNRALQAPHALQPSANQRLLNTSRA